MLTMVQLCRLGLHSDSKYTTQFYSAPSRQPCCRCTHLRKYSQPPLIFIHPAAQLLGPGMPDVAKTCRLRQRAGRVCLSTISIPAGAPSWEGIDIWYVASRNQTWYLREQVANDNGPLRLLVQRFNYRPSTKYGLPDSDLHSCSTVSYVKVAPFQTRTRRTM